MAQCNCSHAYVLGLMLPVGTRVLRKHNTSRESNHRRQGDGCPLTHLKRVDQHCCELVYSEAGTHCCVDNRCAALLTLVFLWSACWAATTWDYVSHIYVLLRTRQGSMVGSTGKLASSTELDTSLTFGDVAGVDEAKSQVQVMW